MTLLYNQNIHLFSECIDSDSNLWHGTYFGIQKKTFWLRWVETKVKAAQRVQTTNQMWGSDSWRAKGLMTLAVMHAKLCVRVCVCVCVLVCVPGLPAFPPKQQALRGHCNVWARLITSCLNTYRKWCDGRAETIFWGQTVTLAALCVNVEFKIKQTGEVLSVLWLRRQSAEEEKECLAFCGLLSRHLPNILALLFALFL